jgi:hypothetical protein
MVVTALAESSTSRNPRNRKERLQGKARAY